MAIFLKVLSGPDAGKTIEMQEGVTIGRSSFANFPFQDQKMSGRHVQVVRAPEGLVLVDLGSKNGFRVDGIRTTKTAFISGSSVRIGSTDFEVINEKLIDEPPPPPRVSPRGRGAPSPVKAKLKPPVPTPPAEFELESEAETIVAQPPKSEPAPEPPKPVRPKWHEYFVQFIRSSMEKIKSKPRDLRPFRRLVKLSVINGIQNETAWTLGYGPRQIGPYSCDLVIEDPGAPPICFSVSPDSDQVIFTTDHPDLVKLNEKSVRTDTLKDGDVISFASTSIQFGFEHE